MNALARLEQVARDEGRDVVASDAVLSIATLPAGVQADALGPFMLRGKAEPLQLYALRGSGSLARSLSPETDLVGAGPAVARRPRAWASRFC